MFCFVQGLWKLYHWGKAKKNYNDKLSKQDAKTASPSYLPCFGLRSIKHSLDHLLLLFSFLAFWQFWPVQAMAFSCSEIWKNYHTEFVWWSSVPFFSDVLLTQKTPFGAIIYFDSLFSHGMTELTFLCARWKESSAVGSSKMPIRYSWIICCLYLWVNSTVNISLAP